MTLILLHKRCLKVFRKLEVSKMDVNRHLFLDTLEQMRELLGGPDAELRAQDPFMTKIVLEFYQLIDEYAVEQSSDLDAPEDTEVIKDILNKLASKIEIIENYNTKNLNKLKFLSDVSPKKT